MSHRKSLTTGDIKTDLVQSMADEVQASIDYKKRAGLAREQGDTETAALYEHIASEEDVHYNEFNERYQSLTKLPEVKMYAVKFYDEEKGIIEGLGIPYGGPLRSSTKELGKDLQGEYFSDKTDFTSPQFDGKAVKSMPMEYHHGLDPVIKDMPIGEVLDAQETPQGKWVKVQLDKANKYYEGIKYLVRQGKLLFSSGAIPEGIKKLPDGFIERWPWKELSLTYGAANPMQPEPAIKSLVEILENTEAIKAMEKKDIKATKADEKPENGEDVAVPGKPAEAKPEEAGQKPVDPAVEGSPKEPEEKSEGAEKAVTCKCVHCGKTIELPPQVVDALSALRESVDEILKGQGVAPEQEGTAEEAGEAKPEGDKPANPSNPGVSQGMAPENHGEQPPAPPKEEAAKPPEAAEEESHVKGCKCDKCMGKAEKPVTDGAQKALEDMTDKFNALVKENSGFKERLVVLESQPANAGPKAKAVKTGGENPHMDITREDAIKTKIDAIERQLADPTLPMVDRQRLSRDKALLEIPGFDNMVSM